MSDIARIFGIEALPTDTEVGNRPLPKDRLRVSESASKKEKADSESDKKVTPPPTATDEPLFKMATVRNARRQRPQSQLVTSRSTRGGIALPTPESEV